MLTPISPFVFLPYGFATPPLQSSGPQEPVPSNASVKWGDWQAVVNGQNLEISVATPNGVKATLEPQTIAIKTFSKNPDRRFSIDRMGAFEVSTAMLEGGDQLCVPSFPAKLTVFFEDTGEGPTFMDALNKILLGREPIPTTPIAVIQGRITGFPPLLKTVDIQTIDFVLEGVRREQADEGGDKVVMDRATFGFGSDVSTFRNLSLRLDRNDPNDLVLGGGFQELTHLRLSPDEIAQAEEFGLYNGKLTIEVSKPGSQEVNPEKQTGVSGPKHFTVEQAKEARLSDDELQRLENNESCFVIDSELGEIDFIRAGKKGGKQLLLIAGTPGQWFDFHKLIPLLAAKGYDVLAISPPGKGRSTVGAAFDFNKGLDAYGVFWGWVFKTFDLERVTPVAFSVGFGEISHTIATQKEIAPHIDRLVSIGGWAPLWTAEKFKESSDKVFTDLERGPQFYSFGRSTGILKNAIKGVFYHLKDDPKLDALIDEYLKGMPDALATAETETAVLEKVSKRIGWYCQTTKVQYDVNSRAQAYHDQNAQGRKSFESIPLLAIVGDHDQVMLSSNPQETTGVAYANRYIGAYVNNSKLPQGANQILVYDHAGHMIPYEWPEKLADDIDRFVSQN